MMNQITSTVQRKRTKIPRFEIVMVFEEVMLLLLLILFFLFVASTESKVLLFCGVHNTLFRWVCIIFACTEFVSDLYILTPHFINSI